MVTAWEHDAPCPVCGGQQAVDRYENVYCVGECMRRAEAERTLEMQRDRDRDQQEGRR